LIFFCLIFFWKDPVCQTHYTRKKRGRGWSHNESKEKTLRAKKQKEKKKSPWLYFSVHIFF